MPGLDPESVEDGALPRRPGGLHVNGACGSHCGHSRVPSKRGHPDFKVRERHVFCTDDRKAVMRDMVENREFRNSGSRNAGGIGHHLRRAAAEYAESACVAGVVNHRDLLGEDQVIEADGQA